MGKYQPERVWRHVDDANTGDPPANQLHETVGWQAIFGTMLVITGVAILFLA